MLPWALLRDAGRSLGWKFSALLVVIPVASLLEGFSLTLLLPLMVELGVTTDSADFLYRAIKSVLAFIALPDGFGPLLVLLVVVLQLQVAMTLFRGILEADLQNRYMMIWKRRLFEAFVNARWLYSMQERTAAQASAILTETGRISTSLGYIIQIIGSTILAIIYAAISLIAAWQVILLLCLLGGGIFAATRPLTRHGGVLGQKLSEASEGMHHAVSEFLANLKLLKVTSTEQRAIDAFGATSERFRVSGFLASLHPRIVLALYMSLGYVLLGSGIYVAIGVLQQSAASLVVSIYVFLRLYVQISNIQQTRQTLAVTLPGFAAANELLSRARREVEVLHDGVPLASATPACIELKDIEARYGDHVALRNMSVRIRPGAVVGLTGASGAGKSTFVDVVAGLIEPTSGTVEIDGLGLVGLNLRGWRRSIGYVAQETLLLRGSVFDNIAWGESGASEQEVRQAAEMAHAHRFIQALPEGYATVIGDRGIRLSGGQKQRIGLARALLGRKRMLILDEATSALDSESEAKILQAVEGLRGEVTIIMVAHRLSTLRLCDQILVLDGGRLIESGSFSTLAEQGGQFSRLWQIQSEQAVIGGTGATAGQRGKADAD